MDPSARPLAGDVTIDRDSKTMLTHAGYIILVTRLDPQLA